MLPPGYVTTGECVPIQDFLDAGTLAIQNTLYDAVGSFAGSVLSACDLTASIDNILLDGAAELQKNVAAFSDMIGKTIRSIESMLRGMVPDNMVDFIESTISGVMQTIKTSIDAAVALFDNIMNLLDTVVNGVKSILCETAGTFLDSVPGIAVSSSPTASSLKNLSKGNFAQIDATELTDSLARASGLDSIFNTAFNIQSTMFNEIQQVNALASSLCSGGSIIDANAIINKATAKFYG